MSSLRRKLVTVSYTAKGQLIAISVEQLPVNAGVQESIHALERGLGSSMLIGDNYSAHIGIRDIF